MSQDSLEQVVRNIDARLVRVEQILPTLATKDDLQKLATKKELEALATKKELEVLATKKELEVLATKTELAELRVEVAEEGKRTRRHFDVVAERLEGHIKLLAEGQVALREQMDRRFDDMGQELSRLDRRVMRLEADRRR